MYLLHFRCNKKKKAGNPRKQPGELILEEYSDHYSKKEWQKFFSKMWQHVWHAKISLSDKKEM